MAIFNFFCDILKVSKLDLTVGQNVAIISLCSSLTPLSSSLCVNPSVYNLLPVRPIEASTFICPTLCLASSRGCLPSPSFNHFRSPSMPRFLQRSVLCFTRSSPVPPYVFHLLRPPPGPPSLSHSVHSPPC